MNRDDRSGMRLYLVSLLVMSLFCLFGTASAQEVADPENPEMVTESLESSEITETSEEADPAPTATINLADQKQSDLTAGQSLAVSAPMTLPDSELASAREFDLDEEIVYLRSDHPYTPNTLQVVKFNRDGSLRFTIRFSSDFKLERGYDSFGIYFFDEATQSYQLLKGKTYSGDDLAGLTVEILGSSVVFRFTSDASIEDNGWQVDEIQTIEYREAKDAEPAEESPQPSESPDESSEPVSETPESNENDTPEPSPSEAVFEPDITLAPTGTETPEPTEPPVESLIPTVTPMVNPIRDELISAVTDHFSQQSGNIGVSEIFVEEIQEQSLFAAGLVGRYASGENSGPEITTFVAAFEAGTWTVSLEGTSEFMAAIESIPAEILPAGFSIENLYGSGLKTNNPTQLSLPWSAGEHWRLTGGPHRNDASVAGQAWSSLDFQGTYSVNKVTAAQDGRVTIVPGCRNFVLISHPDGAKTGYYHLSNIQVSNGQQVGRGAYLGNTSQEAGCGGSATGPHVHFSVRNAANSGIDVRTVDIGGWKAISHGSEYSGCMVRNSDGYQACWGTANSIHNDGSIGSGSGSPPPSNPNCPATSATEAYVCVPELSPAPGDQCATFWFPFTGFNGHTAYLTENAQAPSTNTNYGVWRPNLLAPGTYRVEAFIASHPPINVPCNWGTATLDRDTSNAHYEIHHANGTATVIRDQLPLDNAWLNLGDYYFNSGTAGHVLLRDLTWEAQASTNVSYSAMRFILTGPAPNPVPSVSSIEPGSASAGSSSLQLHVYGNQFASGAKVYWNGSARTTQVVDANHIVATISAADLQSAGTAGVSVVNPAPGGGESNLVNFRINASLGRPTINPITRVSGTTLRVSWNAIPGATGYRLWRSESPNSGYSWVVNVGQATAVVTSVPSTKTYYYRVAALSGSEVGPLSVPVSGTTAMTAPTINPITRVSATSLRVSWNAVPGATGYRLWRSETSPNSGYGWVANVGQVNAVVTSVPSTKTYYYRVAALYGAAVGPLSTPVMGTTDIGKPTITRIKRNSDSVLEITWTPIPGATGYRLWRSETSAASGYGWIVNLGNQTTVRTSVPTTKTYYYRVAALFGPTVGTLSAPASGTTAMAKPTLRAAQNIANDHFRLSWSEAPGADSYILYRSETGPGSGYAYAVNVGKRLSVDTPSPNIYKRYYYKIAGVYNGTVGPVSNVISAMHNPVTFRALSIGEGAYDIQTGFGPLSGTIRDSVQMRNALNLFKNGPSRYIRNVQASNLSKAAIMAQIQSVFAGSDSNDVSLFYFSGHGDHVNGTSYLAAVNGSTANYISPRELRNALDTVPGTTFVIIDACHSGGMIGRGGENEADVFDPAAFANEFTAAFAESPKSLDARGYYVMTAASSDEYSIESGAPGLRYGVFTKALLAGIGWNHISGGALAKMHADSNGDGIVSFHEAFVYARGAALAENPTQHAQVYPGNAGVLFYAR